MLPNGWQECASIAVEAFRFNADRDVLQVAFLDGGMAYDYPCTQLMYQQFERAPSKGQFVNEVLKPHAEEHGWSVQPYPWSAS